MSKERLKELEGLFEDISNDMMPPYVGITPDTVVDVKWVIQYAKEQAERVQELEEIEQEYVDLNNDFTIMALERKRYREALEFYADKDEYYAKINFFDDDKSSYGKVYLDEGEKARKALEGEE